MNGDAVGSDAVSGVPVGGVPVGGVPVTGDAVTGAPVGGGALPQTAAWSIARPGTPQDLAQVSLGDHQGVTVATVSGEVDMSSVDRVAGTLTGLSNLAMGLVVDLGAVEYLDSSGISVLHDLAQRLRRRSQMLIIVCPPGSPPRRMLELTALDTQTVVLDELGPAIEAMRSACEEPAGG
ncbi:MAG TPA: STAS domain-containing protein [Solirubrobacteraceae bacterium]|nr:STAS domain-containing protein [Solirubrobacteraceae bacterium]